MADIFASSDGFPIHQLAGQRCLCRARSDGGQPPVIGLDHQGAGMMMPEHAAIKVPVTSPSATMQGLADGIRALVMSPDLGQRLSEAARRHAASESWSRRATAHERALSELLGRTVSSCAKPAALE